MFRISFWGPHDGDFLALGSIVWVAVQNLESRQHNEECHSVSVHLMLALISILEPGGQRLQFYPVAVWGSTGGSWGPSPKYVQERARASVV